MPWSVIFDVFRRASPACLAALVIAMWGGYLYAGQTFATRESVEELKQDISHGFTGLSARIDYSDADGRVRDVQAQIRTKEREISDLEMVIAEMSAPTSDSATVLKNRAFAAKQDLQELRDQLGAALALRAEAERKYREAAK